jgi:ABC-type hemin transport system substrate-binding protein
MSEATSSSRWLGPRFRGPAKRVVSLVPSLTHAVFKLGAGDAMVGRTEFCVRPAAGVDGVETVGGTKNPNVARILELEPDVVLANREENTRRRVERIADHLPVLLTDVGGPKDAPGLWLELGDIVGRTDDAVRRARDVEEELARELEEPTRDHPRFLYWIWRDPWMAAGHGTYISSLLIAAGWRNALPSHLTRYPTINPESVADLGRVTMLFASEPYAFELPRDLDAFPGRRDDHDGLWQLSGELAAATVDGQLFSWYPSLTAAGLRAAAQLRSRAVVEGAAGPSGGD